MAQLAKTSRLLVDAATAATLTAGQKWTELMDAEAAALNALIDLADALPDGQIVGGLLRFPRGDGYAWYVVVKDQPLTLQWIEFGDRWQVDYPTIRGLRRADVVDALIASKRIKALFAQKG